VGQWDRSAAAAQLVDLWTQRAGLAFTTDALCRIADRRVPRQNPPGLEPYSIKRSGQPWLRLREHVLASRPEQVAQAREVAAPFFERPSPGDPTDAAELRCALAAVFADEAWVEACIAPMLESGYGRWVLLHAISSPAQALSVARRLTNFHARFQVCEGPPHSALRRRRREGAAGPPGADRRRLREVDRGAGEGPRSAVVAQATVPT
jgi:hypothetical protein